MLAARNTIKDDGTRTYMICAEIKTINDDDAKTHMTCVAKRTNQQMEIIEITTRPFTQVTGTARNADDGKRMPHIHPELYKFK